MSSSKEVCNHGDQITLTCKVLNTENLSTQVVWKLPDKTTRDTSTELEIRADFHHNGEFTCTVTFLPEDTSYSDTFTQIVRGVSKSEDTTFPHFLEDSISLTCSYHGDVGDKEIVWTTPVGGVGDNVVINTLSDGTFSKTSTLTISSLEQTHSLSYTCSLTFTEELTVSLLQSIGEILYNKKSWILLIFT